LVGKEASVYKEDTDIVKVAKLKEAVAKNDVASILEVINDRQLCLMLDPLFKAHKDDLLRSVYL
jgi:hypothetical protein